MIVSTSNERIEPRLGPTSFLILGLIGLRGPSTSYQLKVAAGRSVAYFWPFPHTQFYAEPARLESLGLLEVEGEDGGRRRKVYSLTDEGRAALNQWLETPPDGVLELRDVAVLQLFFSEFMSTDDLRQLAAAQVALYEERLKVYADITAVNAFRVGRQDRRMAPLTLGVRIAELFKDFWSEIEANPPA
jgi:PadR family transcriptional regulator, regulatory protein AphA